MHFELRPLLGRTFAELSRKYPYPQTPAISRRHIRGKANGRGLGPWCLALAKPHFWKLGYVWNLFFRLQKATGGTSKPGTRRPWMTVFLMGYAVGGAPCVSCYGRRGCRFGTIMPKYNPEKLFSVRSESLGRKENRMFL